LVGYIINYASTYSYSPSGMSAGCVRQHHLATSDVL